MIDSNSDGFITKRELAQVMKEMGLSPSREEVIELFNNLDYNGDGKVEFPEFVAGMRWLKKGSILNNTTSPRGEKKRPTVSSVLEKKPEKTEETSERLDDRYITDLKERYTVLEKCLKEIISRGMVTAEDCYRKKEYEEAKLVLATLDLDTIFAMEAFVGNLTTEKHKDHYKKMKRRLDTSKQ